MAPAPMAAGCEVVRGAWTMNGCGTPTVLMCGGVVVSSGVIVNRAVAAVGCGGWCDGTGVRLQGH
jgi:hypothetical protein